MRTKVDHQTASTKPETSVQERPNRHQGWGLAVRMVSDFVAGVAVGALIGWAVDKWFSISPFGLIVFLLLGFAAGVMNIMRTALKMSKEKENVDEAVEK